MATKTSKLIKETAKLATPKQHLKTAGLMAAIALTATGINTLTNHPTLTPTTYLTLLAALFFLTTAAQAQRTKLQRRTTAATRPNNKRHTNPNRRR